MKLLRRPSAAALSLALVSSLLPATVTMLLAAPTAEAASVQATFYVAANGSDSNTGDATHPFATLQAARDAIRTVNTSSKPMTGDIVVNVAPGTYRADEPITFTDQDSATGGHRIVYQVQPGAPYGSAKFIGGAKVASPWTVVTSSTGAEADLPAVADGHVYKTHVGTSVDFNTLYVNDTRATMARTGNITPNPQFPAAQNGYYRATGGSLTSLDYNPSDLGTAAIKALTDAQQKNQLDAQVYVWDGYGQDWMTDTVPIGSIDTAANALNFLAVPGHPELNRPKYGIGGGARYFIQGNLGFLDQPGEYYFNKTTGDLYYYPLPGSGDISAQDIVIPSTQKILDVEGSSRTAPVSNLTFDGLQFADTNFPDYYSYGWNYADDFSGPSGLRFYPPEAVGSTLPSYCESTERPEFQVGNITLSNTANITITHAHVKNAGMFGVELYLANTGDTVSESLIEDTGHGGVNIEGGYPGIGGDANGNGYSTANVVDSNLIHDVGQLVGQTAGVTINNATANTVSHDEVYNSPRRGILLMGGYPRNTDPATTPNDLAFDRMTGLYAHDNHFTDDYLHGLQQDGGDDGGFFGVYLYRGSSYRPNYIDQMLIDDVGAQPSMTDLAPNGINLDMGDSGFQLSNVKAVNPQNFNAELNTITQNGDVIGFTNTNVDFGTAKNQLADFNDAAMDYAHIGVDAGFPAAYKPTATVAPPLSHVYFQDSFEHGLDLTKWSYRGQRPTTTSEYMSEGVLSGKGSLEIDSDAAPGGSSPVLSRTFDHPVNKVVTVKVFDRQTSNLASYDSGVGRPTATKSFARADDGTHTLGLGIDMAVSRSDYVIDTGSSEVVTTVPRTFGWHTLTWDYTSGSAVTLAIDGIPVRTQATPTGVSRVELGSDNGSGDTMFDEVSLSGGADIGTAPPLPPVMSGETMTATNYASISGMTVATAPAPENAKYASVDKVGSYLDYRVGVPTTGTYQVTYRVAVKSGGTGGISMIVDGATAKTTSLPSTGGLSKWANVTDSVPLTAGLHTIRLQATTKGWNFESANLAYAGQIVPGTIQATSYDAESGDIQTVSSSEGPAVGFLGVGNSMDYKVDVASSGTYALAYRVAANKAGAVQFLVDGVAQKTTSLPASGGWDTWETVTDTASLTAGPHNIRILVAQDGWNFKSFQLSKPGNQAPGTIEGASYDAASTGVQTIPVIDTGSTQGVGFLQNGSTLDYKVNVTQAKTYTVSYRVAVNKGKSGAVTFQVDGTSLKTTTLPTTGDWQNWNTVTDTVTLPAGQHTIRLLVTKNNWNLHWFSLA